MSRPYYTLPRVRLLQAARRPLVSFGTNSWRACRHVARRNAFDTGMVTVDVEALFGQSTVKPLLADGLLQITGKRPYARLRLTTAGKHVLRLLQQVCIGCGCTDDRACEGGCWWVTRDVCSSCARPRT